MAKFFDSDQCRRTKARRCAAIVSGASEPAFHDASTPVLGNMPAAALIGDLWYRSFT